MELKILLKRVKILFTPFMGVQFNIIYRKKVKKGKRMSSCVCKIYKVPKLIVH